MIPRIQKLGKQGSHKLLERAVYFYKKNSPGNALILLKVIEARGEHSRRFRRLYVKVNAALKRAATH